MLKGDPMFSRRLLIVLIVLAFVCWPLLDAARAQDKTNPAPPPTQHEQARPVKVLQLKYADADVVGNALSGLFASDDVRIIADKRTNSVIVVAPAAIEEIVTGVVAKLDVASTRGEPRVASGEIRPSGGHAMKMEAVPIRGANADLITKALDGLQAARQPGTEHASIVVLKASPAAQKALEAVAQIQTAPPDQGQDRPLKAAPENLGSKAGAASSRNVRIKVLHLSGEEATAAEKALAQALSARGAKRNVVVVNPPRPADATAPAAGDGSTTPR